MYACECHVHIYLYACACVLVLCIYADVRVLVLACVCLCACACMYACGHTFQLWCDGLQHLGGALSRQRVGAVLWQQLRVASDVQQQILIYTNSTSVQEPSSNGCAREVMSDVMWCDVV